LFCFLFDSTAKSFKIYLNSEQIFQDEQKIKLKDYEIASDFLKYQKIGYAKNFAGRITKLNIWSRLLTPEQVLEVHKCQMVDAPDILNWETVQLELGPNITLETMDANDGPCVKGHIGKEDTYVFKDPAQLDLSSNALRKCKAFGGVMREPMNEDEWKVLIEDLKPYFDTCTSGGFWIPIFKNKHNLNWVDQNKGAVGFAPWEEGQPNGGDDHENCVVMWEGDKWKYLYWDTTCDRQLCYCCKLKRFTKFYLKGFCQTDDKSLSIDSEYVFSLTFL
jgi:hypothetical protein